jgi:hypothetical protein
LHVGYVVHDTWRVVSSPPGRRVAVLTKSLRFASSLLVACWYVKAAFPIVGSFNSAVSRYELLHLRSISVVGHIAGHSIPIPGSLSCSIDDFLTTNKQIQTKQLFCQHFCLSCFLLKKSRPLPVLVESD